MAEQPKEVNVDVDKVELEPSDDEEVITKPEDIEETETPSDKSSTEEKPDETIEDEEGDEDKEKLITEIDGKLGDSVEKVLLVKTILDIMEPQN